MNNHGINLKNLPEAINYQKIVLEGKYLDALFKQGDTVEEP